MYTILLLVKVFLLLWEWSQIWALEPDDPTPGENHEHDISKSVAFLLSVFSIKWENGFF